MRAWVGRNKTELVLFPVLLSAVTVFVVGCPRPQSDDDAGPVASANCANSTAASFNYSTMSPLKPSILCPALPESPPLGNNSAGPGQAIYYQDWAWKSFVSLNWPALVPNASNQYARGFPDYSSAFGKGSPDTIPVWGTWKEKRELFSVNASTPGPWNSQFDYFVSYPPCTAQDADAIQALGGHGRLFAQTSKTPLGNSLDEAIEVPTESGPQPAVITNPKDWIAGAVVEPRVWRTSRVDDNTVVYEVKLGWDYYDYVASNELYDDSIVGNSTLAGTRAYNSGDFTNFPNNQPTAAVNFPKRDGKYNVSYCEQYNRNSSQANPCPTGTIQTKSGWVMLNRSEIDSGRFHWTQAQYYRMNTSFPPDNLCTAVGDFGLLGFHIIQKTANQGHYVYATWEQADNDTSEFVFSNYFPGNQTYATGFYPPDNGSPNAVPVARMHPYDTGAWNTSTINDIYHNLMPAGSVWRNYNLIGVQFLPVNSSTNGEPFQVGSDDPTNIGQPFYLANLVVETNWGLQNFQGTPPGMPNGMVPAAFTPTHGFTNGSTGQAFVPNPTIEFNRGNGNLGHNRRLQNGTPYGGVFNMGGCMGCHGVAQANGFDFSFVLQRGQNGAMVEPINGPPP